MDHRSKLFPKNFLWGASTSSHQVEGNNHNQWTVWELSQAKHLANIAEQRLGHLENWESIKKYANDPNNYISGPGIDHYNRYKEDFDILKKLNLNAFRFGLEWSRIEPEEGRWDESEIEHYREYLKQLRKRDIEPILNIWHWTEPLWFSEKGSFENRPNIKYFERFVKKIIAEFGNDLNYIITLNEPNVYCSFSYAMGEWPPQEKSWLTAYKVYKNLVKAQKKAYRIIKFKNPSVQVGIASQLANIQAKRPRNLRDTIATKLMRFFWNWWFLNRIRPFQDFVGFNYYFTDYYGGIKRDNPKIPINDLGWYMEPEGLYPLLLRVWSHYKKPIIVAENGVADEEDQYRRWWIEETMIAMERALSEGVEIAGYLHWSLLDNFEWSYGWWPKFGLVAVDRDNDMKRAIRDSALWYGEQVKRIRDI